MRRMPFFFNIRKLAKALKQKDSLLAILARVRSSVERGGA